MSWHPTEGKSWHPAKYTFDGHLVKYVGPKDEPDLWREFRSDTPDWQMDGFYKWEQPARKNVLRSFNKYVFEAYEYEDY